MSVDAPQLHPTFLAVRDANPVPRLGLAVSGGGDSIAMLHLLARKYGARKLRVLTVDHGLRESAAEEISLAVQQCAELGVEHEVAQWCWDGAGNLQQAAREGRWKIIREWAERKGMRTVCLGHTSDDQAETFLLRLARGSGVDGLAAMRPVLDREGRVVARPLLHLSREELRDWLRQEGIAWRDDPSNDDPRYDRVRARQMAQMLSDLGLTRKRLLQTIAHMQAAQLTLNLTAARHAKDWVSQEQGVLILSPLALNIEADDTPARIMAAMLKWVSGGTYRPRFDSLRAATARALQRKQVTLSGCVIAPDAGISFRLMREPSATEPITGTAPLVWDKRWMIEGPETAEITVKALGDAITHCPDWRATGLPRQSLLASPAIWQNDQLIAAPVAGLENGWSARIVADFHSAAIAIED